MIWKNFPVGLSFPVKDFSTESKRHCWDLTLAALSAAKPENRVGMELYDKCSEGNPGSACREYVCILSHFSVTHSRANLALWRSMGRLMAELSLHYPFYQANALEGFGPYQKLGEFTESDMLVLSEEGKCLMESYLPVPLETASNGSVLIAASTKPDCLGYGSTLKEIGSLFAEAGKEVLYLPLPDGAAGTAYAYTCALRGRFEWVGLEKNSSPSDSVLIGIIPGGRVILDLETMKQPTGSSEMLGKILKRILDLGYRRFLLAMDGYEETDGAKGFRSVLLSEDNPDTRLDECVFRILSSKGSVLNGTRNLADSLKILMDLGASVESVSEVFSSEVYLPRRASQADVIVTNPMYKELFSKYHNNVFMVTDLKPDIKSFLGMHGF